MILDLEGFHPACFSALLEYIRPLAQLHIQLFFENCLGYMNPCDHKADANHWDKCGL